APQAPQRARRRLAAVALEWLSARVLGIRPTPRHPSDSSPSVRLLGIRPTPRHPSDSSASIRRVLVMSTRGGEAASWSEFERTTLPAVPLFRETHSTARATARARLRRRNGAPVRRVRI